MLHTETKTLFYTTKPINKKNITDIVIIKRVKYFFYKIVSFNSTLRALYINFDHKISKKV